jgi:tight adherence protein B
VSRRAVILLVLVAAVLCAPAATAATQATLVEVGGARFPYRSYGLSLQDASALTNADVKVTENGKPVSGLVVKPVGEASDRSFGVVLVLDASLSMRGEPYQRAIDAAKAFAAQRNANQQLGIVTFNGVVETLVPLSSDDEVIADALASPPPLAEGTNLYDGVARGLALLAAAKIDSGAVVVLSDGADTGSSATPERLGPAATKAHTRIFTVGLRSAQFDQRTLEGLSSAGGGTHLEATSPEELQGIYELLGARLANEFLLQYRSTARPGTRVTVEVSVDPLGKVATAGYATPALPFTTGAPFHRSLSYTFWRSTLALVFVSFGCAALFGLALAILLRPRRPNLRTRMSEFVSIYATHREKDAKPLPDKVFQGTERSLERMRWWAAFKEHVQLAGIGLPPVQIVLWTIVATLGGCWLFYAATGSGLLALVPLVVPFVVRAVIERKVARVQASFAAQLPDNLQVLASALRAGHSLVGALSVVVEDAPEPSRSEFRRVVQDEQLGISLDTSITAVARRMESRDLEQVAVAAALQRETGGNTAEVLDRVTDTIRDRAELRRLVKSLTAQGRMSRWVVSLLPVGLLIAITAINPEYMRPLYTESSGRLLLAASAVMVVAGSLVIRKIVNFKV